MRFVLVLAVTLAALLPLAADISHAAMPDRVVALCLRGRNGKLVVLEGATGRVRWERDIADFGHALWIHQGVISDERGTVVLAAGAQRLVGLDARSGSVNWEAKLENQQYQALLATDGKRVFASGYTIDRTLCVEARTGRVEWEATAGGQLYLIGDQLLAVNYRQGGVASLDSKTGREVWKKSVRGMVLDVTSDLVLMTDYNTQQTHAIRASTGEVVWSAGQLCYNGAMAKEVTFLCDQAGVVRTVETSSGKERWTSSPAMREQRKIVAVGEVVFAVGTGSGNIVCLEAKSGRELYSVQGGPVNNRIPTSFAADARSAYIINMRDSKLVCVDSKSGNISWEVKTNRTPQGVVLTRNLAVVATDGQFLGIEARTGRRVWETPGPRMSMFYGFVTK